MKERIKFVLLCREIRGCLVVRYADRIFVGIQQVINAERLQQQTTEASIVEQSS